MPRSAQPSKVSVVKSPFWFTPHAAIWGHGAGGRLHIATLQPDITDKTELLTSISHQLAFPNGPAQSWDSLAHGLRDLAWLRAGLVVLFHRRTPRLSDGLLAGYLDALVRAHQSRPDTSPHLRVVFPLESWNSIQSLLPPS